MILKASHFIRDRTRIPRIPPLTHLKRRDLRGTRGSKSAAKGVNHPPIAYSDISWKSHVSFLVVLPTRDIDNYNRHATLHPIKRRCYFTGFITTGSTDLRSSSG